MIYTGQSKISELRDQLSLDFADGKHLNVVASNLGLTRPPFGFNDAQWRAIVKAIAIQYKQIRYKFEEILEIVLGPKKTQVSSFAETVPAGAKKAVLTSVEGFPQTGTMVIDEGLATEETAVYIYLDSHTNTVFFEEPLLFQHEPVPSFAEAAVSIPLRSGATDIPVYQMPFPDPVALGHPYTVVVGRGTEHEYVSTLTALSTLPQKTLTLSSGAPTAVPGPQAKAGFVVNLEALQSQADAYYLTMVDVSSLPAEKGILSGDLDVLFSANSGSTTSAVVTGPLPSNSAYTGFAVRFIGNVTPALAGVIGYIASNTSTDFIFHNTLPAAVATGDQFVLIANFQYNRVLINDQAVLLDAEIPGLHTFAPSTTFTVLRPSVTVAVAQVQVKSFGWDVFQSDPTHVEILVPRDFLTHGPRSASYIRETGVHTGGASTTSPSSIGDITITVSSTSSFPVVGVLRHNASGHRYSYYVPHTWTSARAEAGATTLLVSDTSLFPSSGTIRVGALTTSYSVATETFLTIPPLASAVEAGSLVRHETQLTTTKTLLAPVSIADLIVSHSFYDSGDYWNVPDVWPGPYVWDLMSETHKNQTVVNNTVTEVIAGPTKLSVDRVAGDAILEVEDASAFPTAVPYNVLVGERSGNVETLAVQQLSLKSRTVTTLSAPALVGDTSLQVSSLSGPAGPLNVFPNAGPYRVAVLSSPTNVTIVTVTGTDTGPNRLNLSVPLTVPFSGTETVVLLSDLLRVSPATADDHLGLIKRSESTSFYPPVSQFFEADTVRPLYTSLTLSASPIDFLPDSSTALVNFGNAVGTASSTLAVTATAGSNTLVLSDSSGFPTTGYPYVVTVGVGRGPLYEEKFHVTNNDGVTTLTLSHNLKWSYPPGSVISFTPGLQENLRYTSRVGSVLNFTPYAMVETTHYLMELVAPSVGTGYPRSNGYDFPLRLPVTLEDRLRFVVDLVRAAGIKVTFIAKR